MSIFININEKRPEYDFLDDRCVGRRCFHPLNRRCYNRMCHGCPDPLPEFDQQKADEAKARGWRIKR